MTDGKGLFLSIEPSGSKICWVHYKIKGKKSQVTIGHYLEMSLTDARIALVEVKKSTREGRNPVTDKLLKKRACSFSVPNHIRNYSTRMAWDQKEVLDRTSCL